MAKKMKIEIEELSKSIPDISQYRKNRIISLVESTNKKWFKEHKGMRSGRLYYSVVTTFKGWQVIRKFCLLYVCKRTKEPSYRLFEAMQTWVSEEGKQYVMARRVLGLMMYYDMYVPNSELTYRGEVSTAYSYSRFHRRVYDEMYINIVRITPWLKKLGYSSKFKSASHVIPVIASGDTMAEYLAKTRQQYMCEYYSMNLYPNSKVVSDVNRFSYAFKICSSHKYTITDPASWLDMINAVEICGGDTHSPKYICPEKFGKMHDMWINRKTRKEDAEKLKKDIVESVKYEDEYHKDKHPYLGIRFNRYGLYFHVLQSVKEFVEEGTYMHHCVFRMGYYKKKDQLVLSARKKNGERVETVRIDLNNYTIAESRGRCNKDTKYHKSIISIVNNYMHLFKNAAKTA